MKEEMERIWDVMDRYFLDEETIQKIKEIRESLTEYLSKELGLNVKEVKRLATGIYKIEIGNEVKIGIEKLHKLEEFLRQRFGMRFDTSSSNYCPIVLLDPLSLFDIYGVGQESYVTDGPWYDIHKVYVIIRYSSFVELDDELLNRAREVLSRISTDDTWNPVIDAKLVLDEKRKYVIKEVYVSIRDTPLCDE